MRQPGFAGKTLQPQSPAAKLPTPSPLPACRCPLPDRATSFPDVETYRAQQGSPESDMSPCRAWGRAEGDQREIESLRAVFAP